LEVEFKFKFKAGGALGGQLTDWKLISNLSGMISRRLGKMILARLGDTPAVVLTGPRQAGKTTLARTLPRSVYFDMESGADRLRLDLEWPALAAGGDLVVLDEAQNAPEVFPRLRGLIDGERKRNGRVLLLGSVSPALMREVSESLAGRAALCELTPLLAAELPRGDWDKLWRMGGYPDGGVLDTADASRFPRWQNDYLTLLAQRDFPLWGLPALPAVTLRFLKMLAAVNAQPWNASRIGQALGVSHHTAGSYLAFLEQAFLIRVIPPWSGNTLKRLVKAPRVYWRDSGLCHALLGDTPERDFFAHPWVGASWEGWVIGQILSAFQLAGIAVTPGWFRTQGGLEADLVLEFGAERWVMEIKLTASPSAGDFAALRKVAREVRATRVFLVSRTTEVVRGEARASVDLAALLGEIFSLGG
jgi:predicted AAA+ superfamily ATPase